MRWCHVAVHCVVDSVLTYASAQMGLAGHIGKLYVHHCFGINEARYHTYRLHKVRMARTLSSAGSWVCCRRTVVLPSRVRAPLSHHACVLS